MVRMDCFQSRIASIFLNHLFPRIRVSSLDSNTSKNDGTCDLPMVRRTLLIIPDDLILAPFAVTITILDGLLISNLRRFWRAEVMILVAAPLSTTADNAFPLILMLIFAAVVFHHHRHCSRDLFLFL